MCARTGVRGFAALLFATASVWSQGCSDTTPTDPNAGMRELYYLSDLPGQIPPLRTVVEGALEERHSQFTAEQLEIAKQVVREQFASEKLEKRVLESLDKQTEREYLDETLQWLRTPLGRKIVQARIAIHSPVGSAEMTRFVEQKEVNPPSPKRLELIERYDDAALSSAMASETVLLSAYGIAVMVDAMKPEGERMRPEAMLDSMNSQRSLLEPIFEETSAMTSLFAFRDLSDEELEDLVVFAESAAGRWYHRTTSSVFLDTLRETTANLGKTLVAARR
jgi:hypothetical protein